MKKDSKAIEPPLNKFEVGTGERFWFNVTTLMRTNFTPPISLKELAARTGINYNTLRTYKARRKALRFDHAYEVAKALDVSFDILLYNMNNYRVNRLALSGEEKSILPTNQEILLLTELRKGSMKEYKAKLEFLSAIMPALNKLVQELYFADDGDFDRFPAHKRFSDIARENGVTKDVLCDILENKVKRLKEDEKGVIIPVYE